MRMPLAWHRERLANMVRHWDRKAAVWGRAMQQAREQQAVYRAQIELAEADGQDDLEANMSSILRNGVMIGSRADENGISMTSSGVSDGCDDN